QRLRGRWDPGGGDPARPPRTGGKGRLRTRLVRGPAAEGDRRRLAALTTNTSHGGPYPPARVRRPTLRQQDRPALSRGQRGGCPAGRRVGKPLLRRGFGHGPRSEERRVGNARRGWRRQSR